MESRSEPSCGTCRRWNKSRTPRVGLCGLVDSKDFKKTAIGGILFANPYSYDFEGEGCRLWRKA